MILAKCSSLFFLFIVLLSSSSSAQDRSPKKANIKSNIKITGVIIDSLTNKPIEFGNFVLYKQKDSSIVYGTVSDKEGKFAINNIAPGSYFARVSFIGYKTRKRGLISVSPKNSEINLDTIKLNLRTVSLNEIQVISDKDQINYEEDKIILKVNRESGNNALEILETSPMIKLDIDGNISLMGMKGTQIFIDGLPMNYFGFQTVEDLKLLMVNEIDKFEIMQNPPLEYDVTSNGGVINIVTKKTQVNSYSGLADLNADTKNHFQPVGALDYRTKSFNIHGSYSNMYSRFNSVINASKRVEINNNISYINHSGETKNKSNSNFFRILAGFNKNKDFLSLQANYKNSFTNLEKVVSSRYSSTGQAEAEDLSSENNTNNRHYFFNSSLAYTKSFEEKGKNIVALLAYSNNSMIMRNNIHQKIDFTDNTLPDKTYIQDNSSCNKNNLFRWSLFYNQSVSKLSKIKLGYIGSVKMLSMDNNYNNYDPFYHGFIEDLKRKVLQKYSETKHSLNLSYSGDIWGVRYGLGFSAEEIIVSSYEEIINNEYSFEYSGIGSQISLSKKLFGNHNISFSFRRMGNYPKNRELNPHIDYSDSTNLSMGNPELKPYYSNSFHFQYGIPFKDEYLQIYGFYTGRNNVIEQVSTQLDSKTSLTTYSNLAESSSFGTGAAGRKAFSSWFSLEPEIVIAKSIYKGSRINNRNVNWNWGIRSNISFSSLKLQFNFQYSSPVITAQDKSKPFYYTNASLRTTFFNKHLSVKLKADDIFNTKNINKDIYGSGFYSVNKISETTRVFAIDLSYYFQGILSDKTDDLNSDEYDDDF
ncbi:MAG: outer membrane beta-barrel protein [Bacillota bacterium]